LILNSTGRHLDSVPPLWAFSFVAQDSAQDAIYMMELLSIKLVVCKGNKVNAQEIRIILNDLKNKYQQRLYKDITNELSMLFTNSLA